MPPVFPLSPLHPHLPKRLQLPLGPPGLALQRRQRRLQPQRVLARDAQLSLELGALLERRARRAVERRGLLVGVLDLCEFLF